MVKVLITGVTGQDGAYLAKDLIEKNYTVYGSMRRGASPKTQRLVELGIIKDINFVSLELTEFANVFNVLREIKPDYIYNLAAQSFVADSFIHPHLTSEINYFGVLNLLEAIRLNKMDVNFYQASTSEMYGRILDKIQDEETPFNPISPYAISKLASHFLVKNYRDAYNLNASIGILFNHESELRGTEFVTRKISLWISQIKKGIWNSLPLGSLDSLRDWGYAPEYVKAMQLITEKGQNDDYVVATNTQTSVRQFLEWCCNALDYDVEFIGSETNEKCIDKKTGKTLAHVDPIYYRATDVTSLQGNYNKINKNLGWAPKIFAKDIASIMSNYDFQNEWRAS